MRSNQIECNSEEGVKADTITKQSETEWKVRAGCFRRIFDNYDALMAFREHYQQND